LLEYSCEVRDNCSQRDKDRLEKLQLEAARIRDTYTTGSSRLDPGLYGVRVVHICVFFSSCVALPIVCPSMKKEIQKKRKSQKESVPVSPALYHGIFMLKSNVDTPIELDTIMCAN
jgi:hypothetical protein